MNEESLLEEFKDKQLKEFTDYLELDSSISGFQTVAERVAYLVKCNGGFDVVSWGCISCNGSFFQEGLLQEEALELMQYSGLFCGVALISDFNPYEVFQKYYDDFVEMKEKDNEC